MKIIHKGYVYEVQESWNNIASLSLEDLKKEGIVFNRETLSNPRVGIFRIEGVNDVYRVNFEVVGGKYTTCGLSFESDNYGTSVASEDTAGSGNAFKVFKGVIWYVMYRIKNYRGSIDAIDFTGSTKNGGSKSYTFIKKNSKYIDTLVNELNEENVTNSKGESGSDFIDSVVYRDETDLNQLDLFSDIDTSGKSPSELRREISARLDAENGRSRTKLYDRFGITLYNELNKLGYALVSRGNDAEGNRSFGSTMPRKGEKPKETETFLKIPEQKSAKPDRFADLESVT